MLQVNKGPGKIDDFWANLSRRDKLAVSHNQQFMIFKMLTCNKNWTFHFIKKDAWCEPPKQIDLKHPKTLFYLSFGIVLDVEGM